MMLSLTKLDYPTMSGVDPLFENQETGQPRRSQGTEPLPSPAIHQAFSRDERRFEEGRSQRGFTQVAIKASSYTKSSSSGKAPVIDSMLQFSTGSSANTCSRCCENRPHLTAQIAVMVPGR
jgi:hypothetical protein